MRWRAAERKAEMLTTPGARAAGAEAEALEHCARLQAEVASLRASVEASHAENLKLRDEAEHREVVCAEVLSVREENVRLRGVIDAMQLSEARLRERLRDEEEAKKGLEAALRVVGLGSTSLRSPSPRQPSARAAQPKLEPPPPDSVEPSTRARSSSPAPTARPRTPTSAASSPRVAEPVVQVVSEVC